MEDPQTGLSFFILMSDTQGERRLTEIDCNSKGNYTTLH